VRILGALGLVALAVVNALGLALAIRDRDWKGIGLMLFMGALLTFFARTLWRGSKLERGLARGRLAEGWAGESIGAFFTSVVAGTTEGRIFIAGAIASELLAVLSLAWPQAIAIPPARSHVAPTLFAVWPIVGFVLYVVICGPRYTTSIASVLLTGACMGLPFYVVYA
jgi:hypothetical protein